MNDLELKQKDGIFVVDSRDVAVMVEKRHDNLFRDIENYLETLENSSALKIEGTDFFIKGVYLDGQGKERPHYLLTKKGCDMVANKRNFIHSCLCYKV